VTRSHAGLLTAPFLVLGRVFRHRRLAYEISKRELLDRYAGQALGAFWAVLQPLAMVLVFLFLFDIVLKLKVNTGHPVAGDFSTYLIAGLVPWMVMQEVLARAPVLIVGQSHLVKQVAFPLEVLAVRVAPPAFVTFFVGFIMLAGYQYYMHGALPQTWAYVPLLALLLAIGCVGFSLLLGALGVFLRDLKDVVQFLLFVGIYVSPIFYTLEAVPESLRFAVYLNPFTPMVLAFQDAVFYGAIIHLWAWIAFAVISLAAYALGARVFTATAPYFGNYL